MKRFLRIFILAALTLSLFAGCSKNEPIVIPTTENDTEDETEKATVPAKDKLVVAMNCTFPPFESYVGEDPVGIDVEIAGIVAEKLGMELEIKNAAFSSLFDMLESGEADLVISAVSVSDGEAYGVYFTEPYAVDTQALVVKKFNSKNKIKVTSYEDLFEKSIGIVADSTSEYFADVVYDSSMLVRYTDYNELVPSLLNGTVAGVIMPYEAYEKYAAEQSEVTLLDGEFAYKEFSIAASSSKLADRVNGVLDGLKKSGKLDEIVSSYYFPSAEQEE